ATCCTPCKASRNAPTSTASPEPAERSTYEIVQRSRLAQRPADGPEPKASRPLSRRSAAIIGAMQSFDAVVIGAGAAGLFCAGIAGQRGMKVLLIDHADKLAEKIRISGGGRCNFTNRDAGPAQFLSANPHFCRSALARYTPQ